MSELKEKLPAYIKQLKEKLKNESNKDSKYLLRVKIKELKTLQDQL